MVTGKIVIVDDDPDILSLVMSTIRKFYKNHQVEILAADTGKAGLELIEREHPRLVLLDIQMPGMDGMEVLHHIRASRDKRVARVPVLMLTVKRDADTVIEAIQKGATDYLVKPVNREELMSRVKKILESDKLPD
ncbi:MAG: response regulator [bacterium]|jgi:DNA-binding response OmpR family regulator|nr:response regulator [bacterium]